MVRVRVGGSWLGLGVEGLGVRVRVGVRGLGVRGLGLKIRGGDSD
jgi:hypothetical protein